MAVDLDGGMASRRTVALRRPPPARGPGRSSWAGLRGLGVPQGESRSANVFRGHLSSGRPARHRQRGPTVPRGQALGAGASWRSTFCRATEAGFSSGSDAAGTTGGFRAKQLTAGGPPAPRTGGNGAADRCWTQRYDKPLGGEQPALPRLHGDVGNGQGGAHRPSLPPWWPQDSYCPSSSTGTTTAGRRGRRLRLRHSRRTGYPERPGVLDGRLVQPDVRRRPAPPMSALTTSCSTSTSPTTGLFQPEVPMYGRKNDKGHCDPTHPVVHTIPGLVRAGRLERPRQRPAGQRPTRREQDPEHQPQPKTHWTKFFSRDPSQKSSSPPSPPAATVPRVTGIVAQDAGHGPASPRPRIHPVYAFDVVQ